MGFYGGSSTYGITFKKNGSSVGDITAMNLIEGANVLADVQLASGQVNVTMSGVSPVFPLVRFSLTNINTKNATATKMGTTANNGQQFVPLFVVFNVTTSSLITVAASISVGTNATSYNDIITTTVLTGLTSANRILKLDMPASIANIAPNTDFYLKIPVAAIGTSQTISADLFGYYL